MLASPFSNASNPATWQSDEAHIIPYWWIFIMASVISAGAQAYPNRKPVIDHALEKPFRKISRSRIRSTAAIE